jgi:hypothetical protein
MSLKGSLAELADRILQLARAVAERQNIPDVSVFERDRGWILGQINRLPRPLTVWILDNRYRTTTLEGFRSIIQWDRTNLRRYVAEFWDCDDYSLRFKSNVAAVFLINSVGFVVDWSEPECAHAYNILFLEGGDPVVYEPQTDRIMAVSEARKYCQYKMIDYVLVV